MILRDQFNAMDFPGLVANGSIFIRVTGDRPAPNVFGPGARSQTIAYVDADWHIVAKAHRYLLPDGTLGASGLPDPKKLIVNGEEWVMDTSPSHSCEHCASRKRRVP